jgi:hypothetical protein
MHYCEEFRERITEHIIDHEDVAASPEFHHELLSCCGCLDFYQQSREILNLLDDVELTISPRQWSSITHRLNAHILNAGPKPLARPVSAARDPRPMVTLRFRLVPTPAFLALSAALLAITIGLARLPAPATTTGNAAPPAQAVYVEHAVPLDPVTVDFLEQSELLLRNVMKIAPSDVDGLAEAKTAARQQLAELEQRKEAAANVPPVVDVMETYETVLRDLRNLNEHTVEEDISDIQRRIQRNGLIANMKAFQPRVTEISFGLR